MDGVEHDAEVLAVHRPVLRVDEQPVEALSHSPHAVECAVELAALAAARRGRTEWDICSATVGECELMKRPILCSPDARAFLKSSPETRPPASQLSVGSGRRTEAHQRQARAQRRERGEETHPRSTEEPRQP